MVGDRDPIVQQGGQHLAPAGGGFGELVGDGGIAGKVERGHIGRRDGDAGDARVAQKFQRQLVIPCIFGAIAGREGHLRAAGGSLRRRRERGGADVDDEAALDELAGTRGDVPQHQPPRLRLDRGVAGASGVAEPDRHAIIARRQGDGEEIIVGRAARLHAMAAGPIALPAQRRSVAEVEMQWGGRGGGHRQREDQRQGHDRARMAW